jgi:hypothetical protein
MIQVILPRKTKREIVAPVARPDDGSIPPAGNLAVATRALLFGRD